MIEYLQPLQVCQIPSTPHETLNNPGYLHPLNGNTMNTIIKASLMELTSGFNLPFRVEVPSLVTAYIETDQTIPTALAISETGGIRKSVARSIDQDASIQNFVHQKGFIMSNVVQLREILREGSYWIEGQALESMDVIDTLDAHGDLCNYFQISVQITPLDSATKYYEPDTEEEFCED